VKLKTLGNMIKVDLACGHNKCGEDWIGVDKVVTPDVNIVHNLNIYPWPFEDNSVDEVNCSHYIEHIPHDVNNGKDLDGLIQFMNELYRILKPGGKATITAPYYTSIRTYGDPTHCRAICDWTFLYYNTEWRKANKLEHMGITCDFDATYDYYISEEMSLRAETVRNKAFTENWNAVNDIITKLVKR